MNISGDNIHALSVAAQENAQNIGPHSAAILNAYLALEIIPSHVGLPILIATFLFSKTVKRHPTLINVCVCWTLSGIVSTMLLYAGQHTGPEPNKILCRAQASLMYGVTPMWSMAIFILVYYVWSCSDCHGNKPDRFATCAMIAAPYFTFGVWSISAFVLIMGDREKATRNRLFFYCSLDYPLLFYARSLFTAFVCIMITIIGICISVTLYRNWRSIRKAGRSGSTDIQLVVRILAFELYVLMSIIFSFIAIWGKRTIAPAIFNATIGVAVMLIFGSQPDLWRLWRFWFFKLLRGHKSSASAEPIDTGHQDDLHGKPGAAHIEIEVSHLVV